MPGVADILPSGDVFRRAFRDQEPAVLAALRSEVDDPVGGGDDVEVVLDDDDGVACRDEPSNDGE